MSACISGWAMLQGRTAVVPDIFADQRIPHDVYRKTFVKSLVMVPVGLDTPLAAIGIYWRDKRAITRREIEAAESLGAMIGEALRRTQAA
jgi:GAF domain-containing protein